MFQYLDYRAFLRDYYVAKKAERQSFSYRAFSRRAGVSSPSHLKRVCEGERNLNAETAERYADAIGLTEDAKLYFCDLVRFNQSTTPQDKQAAYAKLAGGRRYRDARRLDVAQADFHSTWYIPAIYELVLRTDFEPDPNWIAEQLVPKIQASEVKRALATLVELDLLRESSGTFVQTSAVVTTGAETRGLHVAAYHRAMASIAMDSMDHVSPEKRDISSVTICVSADTLSKMKARIQAFRKELLAMAMDNPNRQQVVQLNMQLFPLSSAATKTQK